MKFFYNRFALLFNEAVEGDAGGGGGQAATDISSEAAATTAEQAATPPLGFVNADGTFVQDWHKHEQFKDTPGMDKFKDFPSLVKSYKALESKIGAPPAAPGPPAADAPLEVMAAYREANGIPATPDAYKLKPETIPEGVIWSDEMAKQFGEIFHKNNIPEPVAKAIAAEQIKYEAETARRAIDALQNKMATDEAALRKEWGGSYDTKVGEIRGLVAQLGYDPNDPGLFSNAKIIGFLGKVVGQLSPDSVSTLRGTVAAGGHLRSGPDEAKAIMTDPTHPDYKRYYEGDQDVIRKVSRLAGAGAV